VKYLYFGAAWARKMSSNVAEGGIFALFERKKPPKSKNPHEFFGKLYSARFY
jgi:hypothetical protein